MNIPALILVACLGIDPPAPEINVQFEQQIQTLRLQQELLLELRKTRLALEKLEKRDSEPVVKPEKPVMSAPVVPDTSKYKYQYQWAAIKINSSNYPALHTTVSHLLYGAHSSQVAKWKNAIANLHNLPDMQQATAIAWSIHDHFHGVDVPLDTEWLDAAEVYFRTGSQKTTPPLPDLLTAIPKQPRYELRMQCQNGRCSRVWVQVE